MARDGSAQFAKIKLTIWTDPDFLALTAEAKLLYLFLLTNPKTSRVGVVELIPGKWATRLGLTPTDVDRALAELADHRFVLVDRDTAEVGIRTKVKHDPPATPLQVKGVWAAWERIESHPMGNAMGNAMPLVMWEKTPKGFTPPLPAPSSDGESDGECHSLCDGESDGEWVPREGDADADADTDTERSSSHSDSPPGTTFDLDATLAAAAEEVVDRRSLTVVARAKDNPARWLGVARRGITSELREHPDLGRLVHDRADPDAIADLIEPRPAPTPPPHDPACPHCDGTGWLETADGQAYRCGTEPPAPQPANPEPEPGDNVAAIRAIPRATRLRQETA